MIIYLARHGQTTGDVEDRYGGDYDDQLTNLGLAQAAGLTERLAAKRIEALYASSKLRAQKTATVVGGTLSLTVHTLPEFREHNRYGKLSGMLKSEAKCHYPDAVTGLAQDARYVVEGAESYADFRERILQALAALTVLPYDRIAVITHGGPIRVVFRELLGLGEIGIDDCAHIALRTDGADIRLLHSFGIRL